MSSRRLNQPIRLRTSDDELSEGYDSNSDEVGKNKEDKDGESSQSESGSNEDAQSQSDDLEGTGPEGLKDISFGALAKAQEAFAPPSRTKKRKASELQDEEPNDEEQLPKPTTESKHPDSRPNQPIHRSSKHAPMMLSSKHQVSRKRQVFEPSPNLKFRDPRFDATIKQSTLNAKASEHADRNYSFLTTYQATEVLSLKAQLKKAKDPDVAAELKRQVMSLEAKIRNAEGKQKEREVLRKHKESEKQAIREGKKEKPFFLRQSEVRKQIEQERVDSMGKKARDKMEKRKIKKQKGKEGRDLPRFRRSADG